MSIVISLENVHKKYPGTFRRPAFEALKAISLEVAAGEVFGFIGPNGAGKSTTIRLITGISRPSSGRIRLFGRDCRDVNARRGVGYVPETPSLYDYLTPVELLGMGMSMHRVEVRDRKKHCLEWLARLGLAHVAHSRISTFSKGMAQRTALAHAMCIKPRLLVLDEPLSGLDPVGRREVIDLLAEYRRDGGTIFFSSHVLYDVERLADRFGLIHKGELLTLQSPRELADAQEDLYVIRYQGDAAISPAALRFQNGQYEVDASQGDLPDLLRTIDAAGGRLLEVKPRMSLESVFFKVTGLRSVVQSDDSPLPSRNTATVF